MIVLRLLGSIILCLLVGYAGSFIAGVSLETWYAELKKPMLTPPNVIFTVVWPILYFLMGIAFALVWHRGVEEGKRIKGSVILFFIQLFLNLLWPILFFAMRSPRFAFYDLIVLLFFTLMTIIAFDRHTKVGAFILLPNLFWLGFATYLNLEIYRLNS